jgi:hypothetical protein
MLHFDPTSDGEEELLYSSPPRQFCTNKCNGIQKIAQPLVMDR